MRSTCEAETQKQTEEDAPVGNRSHDDMESITETEHRSYF